ncbi:polyubiquitin-D-like [Chrysemys picta bellii]|uniref:polyubiquitin-D-like n=1 Tax=Chrysemys picta bellii TaxID=8478 RepID=UPI0032B21B0E
MEQGPTGSSAATGGAQGTVFIRTLTGSAGAVDVRWDDSGEDLKRKVIEENIHPGDVDGLRLIFKGEHLEDARSLRHQGLTNHCTVFVVPCMRGGDISSLPPGFPAVTAKGREEAQPPHSSSPDKEEPEEQTLSGGGDISSLPPVFHFPAVTGQGREEAQPPHSSSPDKAEPEEQTHMDEDWPRVPAAVYPKEPEEAWRPQSHPHLLSRFCSHILCKLSKMDAS